MGSVKDLEVVKKPTNDAMGVGRFHFSDRYSVFDWGAMPDHIEGKGAALCLVGAYCFEKLEEKSIKTHYRGLVNKDGKLVSFKELKQPTNIMEFNLVNVFRLETYKENGKLKYNYGMFKPSVKNCMIPLEIIYRNGLPEGSSIFKRLEGGSITFEELGLDHYPKLGERLSKPIFDVSTKLEEKDRYVTWNEAQKIAGLTDEEVEKVKAILLRVDEAITHIASKADFVNEDGKIELAFDPERRLMVADVVGTLDECRFTYKGLHISKEITRKFYRKTRWYREVEEAKQRAETEGVKEWRKLCQSSPPKLDLALKTIISEMYTAATNELTGHKLFAVPRLAQVTKKHRDYVGTD
ncbi:phosphoribosylaminoimidazolesuccinocarboxamide synthase [Candidatus Bathyarchaeota archaeon]|nr:phosphoribosylaminoimidazolesuccinocarboxamide synthase [Candidatus Bathyarchaeota archaeon]MCK4481856.1 phosphoribosylaminoimidazolesuccinocarboxamide synthase [Candidatus Bathyarchaeota archaeon]